MPGWRNPEWGIGHWAVTKGHKFQNTNEKPAYLSGFLERMVEVPGIEPGSEKETAIGPTCLS